MSLFQVLVPTHHHQTRICETPPLWAHNSPIRACPIRNQQNPTCAVEGTDHKRLQNAKSKKRGDLLQWTKTNRGVVAFARTRARKCQGRTMETEDEPGREMISRAMVVAAVHFK
ncbi:hypothetical protein AVEN_98763-1 [Araneus ventricosus]|uniref:Uncharacterized protein n=1 Tax=Araneus ventricosus TaxID=182803 RepID=A0A4Y2FT60_ARAVE|nr:hypothetical protein AVEN_98763-1 [Araneus ventricosus]